MSLQSCAQALTCEWTGFGNEVFADVVRMRSYWFGVSLPSSDWGPCNKRESGDIEAKGGWPHGDEGRRVMLPQAEECQACQQAPKARSGKEGCSLHPSEGARPCQQLGVSPMRINSCCCNCPFVLICGGSSRKGTQAAARIGRHVWWGQT